MKGRAGSIGVGVIVLLVVIGLLRQSDGREATLTTFGVERGAFKAVHDLLVELELPVRRSYDAPQDLPAGATVWWLNAVQSPFEPNSGPCSDSQSEGEVEPAWAGREWLAAGGTAVVFPAASSHGSACESVAGFALPTRNEVDETGNPFPVDAKPARSGRVGEPLRYRIKGPRQDRVLRAYELRAFDESADWTPVAWVGERPLLLERRVEHGRLVVVADSAFAQNAWIAGSEGASFVLDLVRLYGVPLFDENAHGFRPSQDAIAYLIRSPAVWTLAGLCLLGSLIFWRGALVPGRPLDTAELPAPTLDFYVDSLAGWYARTSDHGRVAERYRHYALARLRRRLHLSAEAPLRTVAERLESQARFTQSMSSTLLHAPQVRNRDELFAAAAAFDALILAGSAVPEPRS